MNWPRPSSPPTVAQGTLVAMVLLVGYMAQSVITARVRSHSALRTDPENVCDVPVEIVAHGEARLGCADEPALRTCTAMHALDAVRIDADGCVITRGGMRGAWRLLTGHPMDVNRATVDELRQLAGLTGSQAESLVAYRAQHGPFMVLNDLEAVPGIGAGTVHNLARWLAVML